MGTFIKALIFFVVVIISSIVAIPIAIIRIAYFISDYMLHDILNTLNGVKDDVTGKDNQNGKEDNDGN